MGRFEDKVALITGAGRGQGRSHALRLAEEGADIIGVDICKPIETAYHTLSTGDDLDETVALVERLGRRIVAGRADVRDRGALGAEIAAGVEELGRLDVVSANAGIASMAPSLELSDQAWKDVLDTNLTGAWNTAVEAIPHILAGGRGGSVVFTSSAAGIKSLANQPHYNAAKSGVISLTKSLALELGPQNVRVNSIASSAVDTPIIMTDVGYELIMPDKESPTRADAEAPDSPFHQINALPIPWMDPVDISNALLFLASDEARCITGVTLPVDAGFLLK